jgi:hypothetical protein
MQYTIDELITLARVYLAHTGIAASRLGAELAGNTKLFIRLFEGDDCLSRSAERASSWFDENWPELLSWPEGVPQRRKPGKRPTLPAPPGWELVDPGFGQPPFWRQLAFETRLQSPLARPRRSRRAADEAPAKAFHSADN